MLVMPGLDPGIHAAAAQRVEAPMEWIAGSSPAMTDAREGTVDGCTIPAGNGPVTTMTQGHPILARGY
jgi:hypothetical protein